MARSPECVVHGVPSGLTKVRRFAVNKIAVARLHQRRNHAVSQRACSSAMLRPARRVCQSSRRGVALMADANITETNVLRLPCYAEGDSVSRGDCFTSSFVVLLASVRCAKETADPHDRGVVIVGQGLVLDSRTPKPQMHFSRPQSFVMSAEPEARELSVPVVMGVSGAGKSTIAALPKDPRAGAARIPQRTAPGSFLSPSAQKQRPYNLFNRRCIMCDYSLQDVKSRPAAVGDKLVTYNFGTWNARLRSVRKPGNGGLSSTRD